jgi:hypothetical protein
MLRKSSILLIILSILVLAGCANTSAAPISGDQTQTPGATNTQITTSSSAPAQGTPAPVTISSSKKKDVMVHFVCKEAALNRIKETLDKIDDSDKDIIRNFLQYDMARGFGESSYYPAAQIKVTITNITKEKVEMDASAARPGRFYISLCSKDKNGKMLGDIKYLGLGSFEPKESRSESYDLFSSPEVTDCYLELGYTGMPKIEFNFLENPEIQEIGRIKNQFVFSFKTEYNDFSGVKVTFTITNSSDQPFKNTSGELLVLNLRYKDEKGNYSQTDNGRFLGPGEIFIPGETKKFIFGLGNFQGIKSCDYSIVRTKN